LRGLSYAEGQNVASDWRGAQGKPEQFPALAHELVRLKVDVIVAPNDAAVVAAQNNRTRVPEGSVLPIQVVSGV